MIGSRFSGERGKGIDTAVRHDSGVEMEDALDGDESVFCCVSGSHRTINALRASMRASAALSNYD